MTLNWLAAARLNRAVLEEIKAIEKDMRTISEVADKEIEAPRTGRLNPYWEAQIAEHQEAITQLKDVARYADTLKWAAIKPNPQPTEGN